jgi:3-mercaptopyruvate sulfurtransferase SseA
VALLLRRRGITHIRPLQGGLEAWREKGYPLAMVSQTQITSESLRITVQGEKQ